MTNGLTNLTFNRLGRLKMVDGARVSQGFGWYEGFSGADHTPPSGAYLFRPTKQAPNRVGWAPSGSSTHFSGPVVHEVHQRTAVPWISQVVRLYEGQVGPLAQFSPFLVFDEMQQNQAGSSIIPRPHIFPKAKWTSNKKETNFLNHFLAHFFMPFQKTFYKPMLMVFSVFEQVINQSKYQLNSS